MNTKQKMLLDQAIGGKKDQLLDELMSFYLENGLGSLTKKEIDIFIFHLIEKYQKESKVKWSNYDWSCLLKLNESKIKALRLEVGIRYASDADDNDFNLWIDLLDIIKDGYVYKEGDKFVFTIENPFLLRFVEHKLKQLRLATADYSFNKEIVKIKTDSLKELVSEGAKEIGAGSTIALAKLKEILRKSQSTEALKELWSVIKSGISMIPSL